MMKKELLKVSMRQSAVFIPKELIHSSNGELLNETTTTLLVNSTKLGFTFSEELLRTLNNVTPSSKLEVLETLKEIVGVNKNWTPLVKQWNIPTGESVLDHIITLFANVFKTNNGIRLQCGHVIPNNTFPLERYNGCPFCGTPFEFEALEYEASSNKLTVLDLWTENNLTEYLKSLLASPVALDATQVDSLQILLKNLELPEGFEIKMKETSMLVIDTLVELNQLKEVNKLFKSPNDILRYLWYKKTGFLQIVEPKTIKNRLTKNARNYHRTLDKSEEVKIKSAKDLKLKFNRAECKMYASWINNLSLDVERQCEVMHTKRGIWVRVIRALRLAEYSKRKGFENLAELLDNFYNETYEVWQGKVNQSKLKVDAENTFYLLKQRPGLFARSLFSTMLWFGPDLTIKQFKEVVDKIPSRLIFTLNMYAELYFDKSSTRTVKPLGGVHKKIPSNSLLKLYTDEELAKMQSQIQDLSLDIILANWEKIKNENTSVFIDESLYKIPISIGDRSENLMDLPSVPTGTRFKVEGDTVRLFLQWGEGLPAQHLDMDLSCRVVYDNVRQNSFCSYSQLVIPGCKHSGDIQKIPEKVGTAEYIDIDLEKLASLGAKYVSFTCNAYTNGSLSPNLVVGWMNSKHPMKITSKGVAYNPSQVQHQIRIKKSLTKALVFGVLDVANREIIWLEMNFGGQIVQNMDTQAVEGLLRKLDAKLKIGDLLELRADVQKLQIIEDAEKADEVYDAKWASNSAEVTSLLLSE